MRYIDKYENFERDNIIEQASQLQERYPDHKLKIEIKPYKETRSNQQNRFLRGRVYDILSNNIGYEKEEIHDLMKAKFLRQDNYIKGVRLPKIQSTTDLDTKQFTDYVENIRDFASKELGIYVPEPGEAGFEDLTEKSLN